VNGYLIPDFEISAALSAVFPALRTQRKVLSKVYASNAKSKTRL